MRWFLLRFKGIFFFFFNLEVSRQLECSQFFFVGILHFELVSALLFSLCEAFNRRTFFLFDITVGLISLPVCMRKKSDTTDGLNIQTQCDRKILNLH